MFSQEVFQLRDTWDKTIIFSLIHCYTVFASAPIELKEKENHIKAKMSNKHSTVWKKLTIYHVKSSPAVCFMQIRMYFFYSFNNNFMILSYLFFCSRAPETLPLISAGTVSRHMTAPNKLHINKIPEYALQI